jgi:homogentisate 1,2-dioxygenase
MTDQSTPRPMVQAQGPTGPHQGYMPGFGNDFETEALPGALPQGMNSPRNAPTAFTANSSRAPPSPPRGPNGHGATASGLR